MKLKQRESTAVSSAKFVFVLLYIVLQRCISCFVPIFLGQSACRDRCLRLTRNIFCRSNADLCSQLSVPAHSADSTELDRLHQ